MRHAGGCHCGKVRFEVEAPDALSVTECNCSICAKSGHLHLIVPKSAFHLLSGEEWLTEYRFNTQVAQHLFCRVCGIKPFYVPRSHPDGVSVNVRCLDEGLTRVERVGHFDGRNWEDNIAVLRGERAGMSEELGDERDGHR